MKRTTRTSVAAAAAVAMLLGMVAPALGVGPPDQAPEASAQAPEASAQAPEVQLEAVPGDRSPPYDPSAAGHPLRVAAYVVHPIGVILDVLIFRPIYWIGHFEPFKTLFGQSDEF